MALEGLLIPRKCRIYHPLGRDPGAETQLNDAVLITGPHWAYASSDMVVLQSAEVFVHMVPLIRCRCSSGTSENRNANTKTDDLVKLKCLK